MSGFVSNNNNNNNSNNDRKINSKWEITSAKEQEELQNAIPFQYFLNMDRASMFPCLKCSKVPLRCMIDENGNEYCEQCSKDSNGQYNDSKGSQNKILCLMMKCANCRPNTDDGNHTVEGPVISIPGSQKSLNFDCPWSGRLSQWPLHFENECPLTVIGCILCKNHSCARKYMVHHWIEECSNLILQCPQNCGQLIMRCMIISHIHEDCSQTLMANGNPFLARTHLAEHVPNEFHQRSLECANKRYGCQATNVKAQEMMDAKLDHILCKMNSLDNKKKDFMEKKNKRLLKQKTYNIPKTGGMKLSDMGRKNKQRYIPPHNNDSNSNNRENMQNENNGNHFYDNNNNNNNENMNNNNNQQQFQEMEKKQDMSEMKIALEASIERQKLNNDGLPSVSRRARDPALVREEVNSVANNILPARAQIHSPMTEKHTNNNSLSKKQTANTHKNKIQPKNVKKLKNISNSNNNNKQRGWSKVRKGLKTSKHKPVIKPKIKEKRDQVNHQKRNCHNLYVQNFPPWMSYSELSQLFVKYGKLASVTIMEGYSFVRFVHAHNAKSAITALNGINLYRNRWSPLRVKFADNDITFYHQFL